ncbi:hypothetical protein [Solobacterium sp.]|uniref:hypothetical protein n=1 Tax=Solobacterium sp. TaxID=2060878 RepID=UPI001CAAEB83|nr:hypothetical protein [Solobacterium sp.]MBF1086353.1 hypothetical protein [Solobacterium sp.]
MNKLIRFLMTTMVFSTVVINTIKVHGEEFEGNKFQGPILSSEVQAEIDELVRQVHEYTESYKTPVYEAYCVAKEELEQAAQWLNISEMILKDAKVADELAHNEEFVVPLKTTILKGSEEDLAKAIADNLDQSIILEKQNLVQNTKEMIAKYDPKRTEAELKAAEECYANEQLNYAAALASCEEHKKEVDQCDQVLCDIALKILALKGIDGRTGTMSEEIYEKFYRKKNETTTETVEPTEPEVESVVEETHEEKIEEEVFPVHFTESTAEHSLEMAEIQESTNHPVTPIDFSALSFAVLAGVGIYMARKKH